jgi:hypothetical protein
MTTHDCKVDALSRDSRQLAIIQWSLFIFTVSLYTTLSCILISQLGSSNITEEVCLTAALWIYIRLELGSNLGQDPVFPSFFARQMPE